MPITLANKMVKALAPLLGVLVLLIFLFPLDTLAVFTKQINYQGKLTNSSGVAVTNGSYSIQFLIYDASSGGNLVWSETQTVTVTNGLFSTMLGSVSSLASVDFNQALYITINVGSDGEMTPRKTLGAVPNAFNSEKFDGLATTSFAILSGTNIFSGLNTFSATTTLATTTFFSSNPMTFMQTDLGNLASTTGGFGVKDALNIIGYGSELPTLAMTNTDAEYIYYNDFDYSSTAGTSTVTFYVEDIINDSVFGTTTFKFIGDLDITTGHNVDILGTSSLSVSGSTTLDTLRVSKDIDFSGSVREISRKLELPHKARNVYVSDGYMYVATYGTSSWNSFRIVDISDPYNPVTVGGAEITNLPLADAKRVFATGNYAYILYNASEGSIDNPFRIIDISNKANPVVVGGENLVLPSFGGSPGQPFYMSGDNAYIMGSDTLYIVNVADPYNPKLTGSVSGVGDTHWDIKVSGDYAYTCHREVDGGVQKPMSIINIKDKKNPVLVSKLSIPDVDYGCWSVDISGRYAYLGLGNIGESDRGDAFRIVDISDPANPTIVGGENVGVNDDASLSLPETYSAFDYLKVVGDRLYATTWFGDFLIVDIASSTNPKILSRNVIITDLVTGPVSFDVIGNYLAVGFAPIYTPAVYPTSTDYFRMYKLPGIDSWGGHIDSLSAGFLQVFNNAIFGQRLTVWDSLEVGTGGIFTQGPLSISGTTTSSYFGGSVGIGTTTPYYKLTINASNTTDNLLQVSTTTNQNIFLIDNQGLVSLSSLATNGAVYSNNGVLTNVNPSSLEYKNTINPAELNIDALLGLQVKSFNWNENGQADFGLIAEEVRDALPELYIDDGHVKGYRADHLPFYLLQIAQRQAKQIAELDSRIASGTINFASSSDGVVSLSALQSLAGNWSISADGILTAKKIIAEEAIIENGVTVRDKATGAYTCIFVENGTIQTKLGECSSEETESGGGGAILAPTQGGGETSSTTPTVDESPASTTEDSNSSPSASQPGPAETDQGSNPDPPTETEAPVAAEPVAEPAPAPTETPPATES